ncbi:MAG: polysaccharide deacetylase family protein [Clostridiaceae bacterium]|nr:polysaccharide deacetylase family protein [Clostridiaceae bacterium]
MKKRRLAVLGLFLTLTLSGGMTAYADGPTGPASDEEAIRTESQKNSGPAGPGAMQGSGSMGETSSSGETEGQKAADGAGQKAADAAEQNTGAAAGQMEQTADGMIASGGRFIDPSRPMVALTFDDGPYAPVGNRMMDCLEQYNGRATFFVVGNRIPSYREEILRMKNNGHEVANHSQDHKYLTRIGADQIRAQIEQCNQMIASVTGQAPALVRLPGGLKNETVLANVHQPVIMWSIDTLDWKTRNAANTVQVILSQIKDGDIILMHELYGASADAVEAVVPVLAEQGYQMVTVSELAALRGGAAAGNIYSSFR